MFALIYSFIFCFGSVWSFIDSFCNRFFNMGCINAHSMTACSWTPWLRGPGPRKQFLVALTVGSSFVATGVCTHGSIPVICEFFIRTQNGQNKCWPKDPQTQTRNHIIKVESYKLSSTIDGGWDDYQGMAKAWLSG